MASAHATSRLPAPTATKLPDDGRSRIVIERVEPCVDAGRFPAKRVIGELVVVEADVFADGHDLLGCVVQHRQEGDRAWHETPMAPLVNDRWSGSFTVDRLGRHVFRVVAWIDHFASWRRDLKAKFDAGQDVAVELLAGAVLLEDAVDRAADASADALRAAVETLRSDRPVELRVATALDDGLLLLMTGADPRTHASVQDPPLELRVDRPKARFSTWYEMFPRSAAPEPGRHGTFRDVEARLPYVASMGFDVLYLPPVHPVGVSHRKGPNNSLRCGPEDVGSPWAIGSRDGGHTSIHPELGTLDDFRRLVRSAADQDIEIALDIAFQCSPDHPWVKEHSEWFRRRPDGTIQYAENPPKRYQDIYPLNFETEQWPALWAALRDVFLFWVEQGVRIFRVDNPHTKSLPFWEWCLDDLSRREPDVLFLSEAFTRPKLMYRLAKAGFTQSYTYFAWRNEPWELEQYFTEINRPPVSEFFRPNAWPNTPDILTEFLQHGGRAASAIRLVLAATLAASYGIYGPPFELSEVAPRELGTEEYLDSEKYQLRTWDLERPDSLRTIVARINAIRRENPALQQDRTLRFHKADNPALVCYSKSSPDGENVILTVVNTNPHAVESGTVTLDTEALGLAADARYQVDDLLTGTWYQWSGSRQFIQLDPGVVPAHVLRVHPARRSERDFEYYF